MKLSTFALAVSFVMPAATAVAQGVTDPQIASIVVTANQVDIDAGKIAVAQASNAEVKKFGRTAPVWFQRASLLQPCRAAVTSRRPGRPSDDPNRRDTRH